MDCEQRTGRLRTCVGKYRWAALILAAGLLLMALPEDNTPQEETIPSVRQEEGEDLEEKLELLLEDLEGAGKVRVLLSQAAGAESHFQTDSDSRSSQEAHDRSTQTVIITGSDRSQQALIRRTDPPRYLGAVVLCQGADRPAVKLAVVDAVATATGLTSDKISVWKLQ